MTPTEALAAAFRENAEAVRNIEDFAATARSWQVRMSRFGVTFVTEESLAAAFDEVWRKFAEPKSLNSRAYAEAILAAIESAGAAEEKR